MAVHPTRPLFATAAEDATVAVWMLSEDQSQVSNNVPHNLVGLPCHWHLHYACRFMHDSQEVLVQRLAL